MASRGCGSAGSVVSEGQGVTPPPLEPDVLSRLAAIGLTNPDPDDPLHVALVAALRRTRGHSWGAQIVAMTFEFNWAHKAAGESYAKAKVNHERLIAKETVRLKAAEKISQAEAARRVEASDEAFDLRLAVLLGEQQERSLRSFLGTLALAMKNYQTDRADDRASSAFQAAGHVPEQK